MFKWIKVALNAAASLVGFFTQATEKPVFSDLLQFVLMNILPEIDRGIRYGTLSTKEKIDAWLEDLDARTGIDPGAVGVIPDMPPDCEERFFDALKAAAREYAYTRAKIPGHITT